MGSSATKEAATAKAAFLMIFSKKAVPIIGAK
jgi:hypothetical protein